MCLGFGMRLCGIPTRLKYLASKEEIIPIFPDSLVAPTDLLATRSGPQSHPQIGRGDPE